jgi:hypothetical protein
MKALTANDQLILDRLLSNLAGRLGGAIEIWTPVCLENLVPDRHDFLAENCDIMRSLAVVIRALLAEAGLANHEPVRSHLERMSVACQKLQTAFFVLEQFRQVPLEDLRSATEALTEVRRDLYGSVQELAQTLGFQVSYLARLSTESDEYYQRILRGLFELFREARTSKSQQAEVTPVR